MCAVRKIVSIYDFEVEMIGELSHVFKDVLSCKFSYPIVGMRVKRTCDYYTSQVYKWKSMKWM